MIKQELISKIKKNRSSNKERKYIQKRSLKILYFEYNGLHRSSKNSNKSQFQEEINSPIKMALIDDRINHRQDYILVYPKFVLDLKSTNLHKLETKKALGEKLPPRISIDSLHICEISKSLESTLRDIFKSIRNMSSRVDNLNQTIRQLSEGKSLRLKNLDDPTQKKEYAFSSSGKVGVQTLANICNNINQLVARCWLNTLKLNNYFGIQKDISKDILKFNKPFNQFKKA
uniref:Uncharacterized protein n=1 Tax=Lactuca sativa TaxID=4236 RepID=A0A9R1VD10_LACSA|nr:hypothetical protein LSAT_V11C500297760 [Lactuca sativa]